jgi:2-iminobutanoate/2-iminopropanoate deaminase
MNRQIEAVATGEAPGAIGPYSQAIIVGDLLFVSGQLPIDPSTGQFNSDDPVEQMRQCLANIRAVAKDAGTDLSRVVKTTILLTDLSRFAELNEAYGAVFSEPYPARSTFEVSALPKGAKVEVEAVIALAAEQKQ